MPTANSSAPFDDFLSFLSTPDEPAAPPEPPKWFRPNAPRITLENCVKGTGPMQKMLPGEIAGKGRMSPQDSKAAYSAKPKQNPGIIGFGKHRGKLIVDVAEEDPQYISWCIREDIQGMREKCEKLGITEDTLA